MAMESCACASTGASLTPSPDHRHDGTLVLQRAHARVACASGDRPPSNARHTQALRDCAHCAGSSPLKISDLLALLLASAAPLRPPRDAARSANAKRASQPCSLPSHTGVALPPSRCGGGTPAIAATNAAVPMPHSYTGNAPLDACPGDACATCSTAASANHHLRGAAASRARRWDAPIPAPAPRQAQRMRAGQVPRTARRPPAQAAPA